jgi:hypothetical protein
MMAIIKRRIHGKRLNTHKVIGGIDHKLSKRSILSNSMNRKKVTSNQLHLTLIVDIVKALNRSRVFCIIQIKMLYQEVSRDLLELQSPSIDFLQIYTMAK